MDGLGAKKGSLVGTGHFRTPADTELIAENWILPAARARMDDH
jgi:hypothetical protein